MTIAEVAEKYGLTADTLRYYEKIGLLAPVSRTKGGIRNYSENECEAVEFIKCMRNAGVSVEALIEYVSLFQKGKETRQARIAILMKERDQLTVRLAEMREALDKLNFKIENYDTIMLEVERKIYQRES
jgi:DNA-binding transcriptional MerR regulator